MCKVSVAMSVHNGEKYLSKSIESILNQSFTDFEFIICDDASTDSSREIIEEFMKKDERIVLIQNKVNLGLAASLNKCISLAKGEYIARMDDDDISMENRFKTQVDFLKNNSDISFVCGRVYLFDENGVWGESKVTKALTLENVYKYQPIAHPTVMIRKNVLNEVGDYTVAPYTKRGQDFDLWCKIYQKGYKGVNIGELVLYYRNNKEAYARRKFRYRVDSYILKKMWRRKLNLPLKYELYAYKPIIAGLIPAFVMRMYHSKKF
jgi:glycosyltransferase EpsE